MIRNSHQPAATSKVGGGPPREFGFSRNDQHTHNYSLNHDSNNDFDDLNTRALNTHADDDRDSRLDRHSFARE